MNLRTRQSRHEQREDLPVEHHLQVIDNDLDDNDVAREEDRNEIRKINVNLTRIFWVIFGAMVVLLGNVVWGFIKEFAKGP